NLLPCEVLRCLICPVNSFDLINELFLLVRTYLKVKVPLLSSATKL
ncbi:hypothetical protein CP02DC14_1177, partial [Chlamydia psittaci 02DC14]